MEKEIKLYLNDYHKILIKRGNYFFPIKGNITKISNLEALAEIIEIKEDAVEFYQVLGEVLRSTGISLKDINMN